MKERITLVGLSQRTKGIMYLIRRSVYTHHHSASMFLANSDVGMSDSTVSTHLPKSTDGTTATYQLRFG